MLEAIPLALIYLVRVIVPIINKSREDKQLHVYRILIASEVAGKMYTTGVKRHCILAL